MRDDEAQAVGLNDSLTHVSFMIGSGEMEITAVGGDGGGGVGVLTACS